MEKPPEMTPDGRKPTPLAQGGRVVIVGARRDSKRVARQLRGGPWPELPVVGYIDAGHSPYSGSLARSRQLAVHPSRGPVPVLGDLERLSEVLDRSRATHLVVAASGGLARRVRERIGHLVHPDVRVHWIGENTGRVDCPIDDRPRISGPLRLDRAAKRLVDILGSALGLLFLSPLFLGLALVILITSGRPIFYRQERVTQGGRMFRMLKFRSMGIDAEGQTGPIWATNSDDRCTRVGLWLRQTNIDELPQLWNVLTGEMSLVGPRPERPVFVNQFRDTLADYDLRHVVPGGMTGWAQVHGWRGRTSLRKRVQYDLDYIQRWSFWLDFRVLLMTVQHVAWGKTQWQGDGRSCLASMMAWTRRRPAP
jgi:undecaprenyl-phosphate glucose phosphotransferase